MHSDVMAFYGFYRDFDDVGDFEVAHHRSLLQALATAVDTGALIALTGEVGSGKTRLLHRLQIRLQHERGLHTAWSLAIEKKRVTLATLIAALCYDLTGDHTIAIPRQASARKTKLLQLLREPSQPAVLFVDDSHDIPHQTLTELQALQEQIRQAGSCLTVVLAGLPALAARLPLPAEEDATQVRTFELNGVAGHEQAFIAWLIEQCRPANATTPVLVSDAVDRLAGSSSQPLRLVYHLRLALEEGYRYRQRLVTAQTVASILRL